MSTVLTFKKAERIRNAQTKRIQNQLIDLYKDVAKEQRQMAEILDKKGYLSARMQATELRKNVKRLEQQIELINQTISRDTTASMKKITTAVIQRNIDFYKSLGLRGIDFNIAFRNIPEEVVRVITSGSIYGKRDYLSRALWNYKNDAVKRMEYIVSKGITHQKSSADIARDLEKFVRPSARKKSKTIEWIDDVGRRQTWNPGRVDYNALRLSRTMLQHGYQQSLHATLDNNPFLQGYKWVANGTRTCPLCEDRDGTIYRPENLPYDHPNGMCVFEVVMDDTETQIDRIARWQATGEDDVMNEWADSF